MGTISRAARAAPSKAMPASVGRNPRKQRPRTLTSGTSIALWTVRSTMTAVRRGIELPTATRIAKPVRRTARAVDRDAIPVHADIAQVARSRPARGCSSLAWSGRGPAAVAPEGVTRTRERSMSYLAPSEFVTKMVDAGESKILMSTRDTLIRAYMAGAILALAASSPSPSMSTPASRWSARCCFRSASACSICWASTS